MADMMSWADKTPDKIALIDAEGQKEVSYATVKQHALAIANWLYAQNLKPEENIAFLLDNQVEMIEIGIGARFCGLYYTAIGNHLASDEVQYILQDSSTKVLFVNSHTMLTIQPLLPALLKELTLKVVYIESQQELDNAKTSNLFQDLLISYNEILTHPIDTQSLIAAPVLGRDLLYSSGTTGRPKGIKKVLAVRTEKHQQDAEIPSWQKNFDFNENTIYLTTAPMYHAAPFRYVMRTLDVGGTCVIMRKFDPELSLAYIEKYQITHSQWVPTMFVRLLRLNKETQSKYNLKSMQVAIHAAAPCSIETKRAMLEWWGNIIYEYYAGSEGIGTTLISPQEWWQHQGSVGRITVGKIHILDDQDQELPANEIGRIFFSETGKFNYLNDPEKTKEAFNPQGWATYGDIGYVDEEGFLFLCDRRSDLILSGGVNIYPQEIENVLINHPSIEDLAVVGVPDIDFGEVPKAIIKLHHPEQANEELAKEIFQFCREKLSRLKVPKSIDFRVNLPRMDSGKLSRKILKNEYRENPELGFNSKQIFNKA